jgi:hypothetical protein
MNEGPAVQQICWAASPDIHQQLSYLSHEVIAIFCRRPCLANCRCALYLEFHLIALPLSAPGLKPPG